ncbi:MAG: Asp-tRNA(Asn)/Glu-tRNA(Gln) amidotransferase subunit GatC [Pedosphaera sp.]|nr:Asp-tRNA(Asn)/Glu-tRNA(Gln) amidotransferase subunit GatC [Pedosphaera sp.]
MSDFNVHYVAKLARIALSPDEEERLGSQLGNILSYIEKLKSADVSGVEPTAHAFPLLNVTRPDVVETSLTNEEALRNAPSHTGGLFVVPNILE